MPLRIILLALALFAGPMTDACATAKLPNDTNALDDTSWSLSGLSNQSPLPDRRATIHFENGRVHGTDGCNRYSASYAAGDARFKVGEGMVTTKMACPEPLMQQAAAFMRVLSEASGYRRDTARLALLDADGKELAVFDAQSSELGGTSRIVIGQNSGKQAVVSVAEGSEPTAVFNSDGTLKSAPVTTDTQAFRARGNEPPWQLEITDTIMTLLVGYEKTRIEVPTPAAGTGAAFRRYLARTDSHDAAVTIFDRPCADTMTGMPYPHEVAVVFDGRKMNGCGGDPAALLQGAEWVVEDINRTGIIDRSRATLNFGTDGCITGRASCNTYTGEYTLTGEGLAIAKIATTRMACAPALMRQEDLFLDLLRNLQRFTPSPDGARSFCRPTTGVPSRRGAASPPGRLCEIPAQRLEML